MTELQEKLLDAARTEWVSGKHAALIMAVNAETLDGDVLIRMPADHWRILTDALYAERMQLGRQAWMIVSRIEAELPTRVEYANAEG